MFLKHMDKNLSVVCNRGLLLKITKHVGSERISNKRVATI